MTCHDMQDLLVAYAGDELAPAQREFVELHLERCGACREIVTDLKLTHRQLERLREDDYRPQLAGRITRAIARRQFRTTAGLWLVRGARLASGVAATLLIGFALAALWRGRLPFGLETAPASRTPASPIYTVARGALLRISPGEGTARRVAEVDPQAVMAEGGGRRFLLNDGFLTEVNLRTGELRKLVAAQGGRQLWASPDGKTVWLLRQENPENFALDTVDTETGKLEPDPNLKPGYILAGTVSQDGRRLYLLGAWQGTHYLKVVDLQSRKVLKAHGLPEVDPEATPLAPTRSDRVYVAGHGWLAVVEPEEDRAPRVFQVPGLTPQAVLTPDDRSLVAGHSRGGLLAVDPETGKELRRAPGSGGYVRLTWSDDGGQLYAETGGALEVRSRERLALVGSPIPLSGFSPLPH